MMYNVTLKSSLSQQGSAYLITIYCLPYTLVAEEWEENINKFPDITWRNVTEYLIETPSLYTKKSMKAYKSLEVFNYFVCGHVQ